MGVEDSMAQGKGKGKTKEEKQKQKVKQLPVDYSWKSRLVEAYNKAKGKADPLSKGSITYDAVDADGGGYTGSVTSDKFAGEISYSCSKVYKSKKKAEESAAMEAVKAEFPDYYAATPNAAKKIVDPASGAPKVGEKRKLQADPMHEFTNGLQAIAGRALTKED